MHFDFTTAHRILFGPGTAQQIGPAANTMGRRPLIVTGRTPDRVRHLTASLDAAWLSIPGEPTVDEIRAGLQYARAESCDLVIAIGGGSAIDAGKAIAILATHSGEPLHYLEGIGLGKPLDQPSLPFIAVPTTAGAGAEVTRNAVLASPQHRVKASLRSAHMLPRLAIVDPDLTLGLPPSVTAATGLDALTQLIEPYVSSRANAFTGMLCLEGIRQATAHLRQAFHNPADRHARIAMAQASLYSGMALANAGLGAVHGFAAPIGGMYPAPHGAVCAALLPHVIRVNLQALEARQPQSPSISRYRTVLEITGGLQWIEETCRQLEIPPLSAYGIIPEHYPDITAKAAQASSMKANPISLTAAELTAILQLAA